ncbi:hypothetical protein BDZ45DRAFT_800617, partial [Acephala macrosclerotiorum]
PQSLPCPFSYLRQTHIKTHLRPITISLPSNPQISCSETSDPRSPPRISQNPPLASPIHAIDHIRSCTIYPENPTIKASK